MLFKDSTAKHTSGVLENEIIDGRILKLSKGFDWFLNFEQRRNQRTHGTVCVLSLDLKDLSARAQESRNGRNRADFDHRLLDLVIGITRDSDLVFANEKEMRVLLSNCDKEGAMTLGQRLCREVCHLFYQNTSPSQRPEAGLGVKLFIWDYRAKIISESVIFESNDSGENCNPINRL